MILVSSTYGRHFNCAWRVLVRVLGNTLIAYTALALVTFVSILAKEFVEPSQYNPYLGQAAGNAFFTTALMPAASRSHPRAAAASVLRSACAFQWGDGSRVCGRNTLDRTPDRTVHAAPKAQCSDVRAGGPRWRVTGLTARGAWVPKCRGMSLEAIEQSHVLFAEVSPVA